MRAHSRKTFGILCRGLLLGMGVMMSAAAGGVCLVPMAHGTPGPVKGDMLLPDVLTPADQRVYTRGWIRPAGRQNGKRVLAFYTGTRPRFAQVFGRKIHPHLLNPSQGRFRLTAVGVAYSACAFGRAESRLWAVRTDTPLVLLDAGIASTPAAPESLAGCLRAISRESTPVFILGGTAKRLPDDVRALREAYPDTMISCQEFNKPFAAADVLDLQLRGLQRRGGNNVRLLTADSQAAAWAARSGCTVWLIGPGEATGVSARQAQRIQRFESLDMLKESLTPEPIAG